MKKITMVFIGCFISFFPGLLNSGCAEDVNTDFDFSVVFPKDDVVYLNGNPCLALIWRDKQTGFDSKADFDARAVYEVSIWGDNSFKEPICKNWLSKTNMWVINMSIANEIGLESEKIYFWNVKRFSQSEGRMISTDMGSFSVEQNQLMNFSGHLCGHVSTGHVLLEVTRNGHTEELYVHDGWYSGAFSTGSYSVCAGNKCYVSVEIKALDISERSF